MLMPDTSYTTRHAGMTLTSTSGVTVLHLWNQGEPDVIAVDDIDGPVAVCVTVDAGRVNGHDEGLTKVYLPWKIACELETVVSRRRERYDYERHTNSLHLIPTIQKESTQ